MTLPRHLARQLSEGVWPRLLIEHGKHDPAYYHVTGPDEVYAVCIGLIRDRLDGEYIYKGHEHYRHARAIVQKGDGEAAFLLVHERSDYEYERVELREYENRRNR